MVTFPNFVVGALALLSAVPALLCAVIPSPWLTAEEAAKYLRSGVKLVYRESRSGRLRCARVGGRRELRYRVEWLDRYLESASEPIEVTPQMRRVR